MKSQITFKKVIFEEARAAPNPGKVFIVADANHFTATSTGSN
jgi:hypothetical protein